MPNLPKQPRPTNMATIRRAWSDEHSLARQARPTDNRRGEWVHLERAHVLSQPLAGAHIRAHRAMLGYGIRQRDDHEIVGQLFRLLVAGPGSALGRYPVGNTGGASVNAMRPMPIPAEVQALLDATAQVSS